MVMLRSIYDLDIYFKFKEIRRPLRFIVATTTNSAVYLFSLELQRLSVHSTGQECQDLST